MNVRWLGRIEFEEALALQEDLVRAKIDDLARPDELLLLEHDPVYTIGLTANQSSLRDVADLPHRVIRINRGGQATFHGPGQLVGYPIVDLRTYGQDLHRYLRSLEGSLLDVLARFGVEGERRGGLTGVWVKERKIASIGVGVRRWVTMHGFALNVCGELSGFAHITPCGIEGVEMTSLTRECGRGVAVEEVAQSVAAHLPEQLRSSLLTPRTSGAD